MEGVKRGKVRLLPHNESWASKSPSILQMLLTGDLLHVQPEHADRIQHGRCKFPVRPPRIVFHEHAQSGLLFRRLFDKGDRPASDHALKTGGMAAGCLSRFQRIAGIQFKTGMAFISQSRASCTSP